MQGPIDDAFCEAFLCVRGTGKPWHDATQKAADARLQQFAADWSKHWRGQLPIKDDADVTNDDIANRHLILFGDPSSNSLLAQITDALPLEWSKESVGWKGVEARHAADRHLPTLIYPNPLNAQRYVVLNSGPTIPSADYQKTNALLFPRLGDYAILTIEGSDPSAYPAVDAGLFDEYWTMEQKK
jgi:hypothetical protein